MTFFTLVIGEHRPFISLGRQDHSPASDWRVHLKRAVRINIGSSKRDKCVDVERLGETVRIKHSGTDGDMRRATELFIESDGKVDVFGVGGNNVMEAALIAVPGNGRALNEDEL